MRHPNGLRAASGAVGGWTLANAVYSGVSFNVSVEDNTPQGLFFRSDGAKMYMEGRCIVGTKPIYNSWAHGSKGVAIVSKANDCGMPSSTYKGQLPDSSKRIWLSEVKKEEQDPYLNEWNDLLDAIRNNRPYNEVPSGVAASVATSMGRMAAHTGQEITYDEMLNHEHEYAPGVDKWTMDSPAPLVADAKGRYPVPMPGLVNGREYGETTA